MDNLVSLLDIERKFRYASSSDQVLILAVNLLRNLFPYQVAIAFSYEGGFKPKAYSDTPFFDKKSSLIKSFVTHLNKIPMKEGAILKSASEFDPNFKTQGLDFAMVLPLVKASNKQVYGAIIFLNNQDFTKETKLLAEHSSEIIALSMAGHHKKIHVPFNTSVKFVAVGLVLTGIFSINVPLSSQAKAQVVPLKPYIVTAPMNGIIKSVNVKSNDSVKRGDFLLSYDDMEIKGKKRIAAQTINISSSEIVKQERASFFDPGIRNRLEESRADKAVKTLEYQAISAQLSKLTIFSSKDGTVILDNPIELIGKPVQAGEKLLSIVDPSLVEIEILLPAHETHAIIKGNRVSVFLDNAPFKPISGIVDRVMYEPVITSSNIVSYKAYVKIHDNVVLPLGICGNAKVYGEEVSLFMYIFRKSFAFVRWYFG